jgi:hypothetical protein
MLRQGIVAHAALRAPHTTGRGTNIVTLVAIVKFAKFLETPIGVCITHTGKLNILSTILKMVNIKLDPPIVYRGNSTHPAWLFTVYFQRRMKRKEVYSCVAGSTPLRMYIDCVGQGHKYPNFEPGDFDLFVGRTNAVAAFPDVFNNVAQFMQDNPLLRIKGFEAVPAPQGTYAGLVKICFIVNFKLAYKQGVRWTNMQLVIMEKPVTITGNERWALHVMQGFDISICRVAITDACDTAKFTFLHRNDSYAVIAGSFTAKLCDKRTQTTFVRITKYLARGFTLERIIFGTAGALAMDGANWQMEFPVE